MKINLVIISFLLPFYVVNAQQKEHYYLYIKLQTPIKNVSSKLAKINTSFSYTFKKDKLLSKILHSYIYKTTTPLLNRNALELSKKISTISEIVYTNFISNKAIKPPYDIPPVTPNYFSEQTYLLENSGVNALYSLSNDIDGKRINIRVVEYGLNTEHEEFNEQNTLVANGMIIHSDVPFRYYDHGTSTAGIIFAQKNEYGITGIAHNANEYILYPEWTQERDWDRPYAVAKAIDNSTKGDVIIFEMQTYGQYNKYVPAEFDPIIWDLTKVATDKGIIIVAAAGNGEEGLDKTFYNDYLLRGDSGAIIVGAGTPDSLHNTLIFSTYGSRVNVQGWGHEVFTTSSNSQYLNQGFKLFSGTSSATALVSACVVALQSYYYNITNSFLTSVEMRDLLIKTGSPQGNGFHIGPLPDIKKAILEIDRKIALDNNANKNISHLIIFPNPVKDFVNIRQINIESKTIEIYNQLGQKVLTTLIDKKINKVNISNFTKESIF